MRPAKLTPEQVVAIREDERRDCDVARAFGVSRQAINKIRTGMVWKHVGGPRSGPRRNKLTVASAARIRADQRPHEDVARDHGVSVVTVYRVRAGLSWAVT